MLSKLTVNVAIVFLMTASVVAHGATAAPAAQSGDRKPNVIFILADDLGYGDVGFTFQNSRRAEGKPFFVTPNLDRLSHNGLVLRQHYTGSPVCAPARASLLTGQSQGICPIRDNQFDKPIPESLLTLGSVLQQAGYRTMAVGKWGLAGKANSDWPAHPMRRGFDDFFGFMLHGTGHVYYHDAKHPLMDGLNDVGDKYENVYSTDLFTARAKKMIVEQHAAHPEQPFFMYLAYTAVHNALQVPGEPYPAGGGLHGGAQWPLQPTPKTRNTWIYPDYANKPWKDQMKRYATMAHRLDDGVGDVMKLLSDLGIEKDTLVIFTSDNGPANEGGADPRLFDSWGPFDGFKRDVFEGGVREPTVAVWPGHVPAGKIDDSLTAFWDWMPTLAELAHVAPPAQSNGISLVPNLLGQAEKHSHPYLYFEYEFSDTWAQPATEEVIAHKGKIRGQQQMVRIGDFTGVRTQIKKTDDPLRLYNLANDPHEDHDLSHDPSHAELLAQMRDLLVTARRPDPDAKRPYDNAPMPAVNVNGLVAGHLARSTFEGEWPWTPDFGALHATKTDRSEGLVVPEGLATPYGLEFSGYLKVPSDGEYTFMASSDLAVHLWLHDAEVLSSEKVDGKAIKAEVRLRRRAAPDSDCVSAWFGDAGRAVASVRRPGIGGSSHTGGRIFCGAVRKHLPVWAGYGPLSA